MPPSHSEAYEFRMVLPEFRLGNLKNLYSSFNLLFFFFVNFSRLDSREGLWTRTIMTTVKRRGPYLHYAIIQFYRRYKEHKPSVIILPTVSQTDLVRRRHERR